jgi:hypothetical protein
VSVINNSSLLMGWQHSEGHRRRCCQCCRHSAVDWYWCACRENIFVFCARKNLISHVGDIRGVFLSRLSARRRGSGEGRQIRMLDLSQPGRLVGECECIPRRLTDIRAPPTDPTWDQFVSVRK